MAFIHTNFLTGNDTTGDGSVALPYKTMFKALGLAASNDTIKVAGGQWTGVTGPFTFTQGTGTTTVAGDLRTTLPVNTFFTFEDGQFGFDKFHCRVNAVTYSAGTGLTTVTINSNWPGPTVTVGSISILNAYHYNSTSSVNGFETWNDTSIQPAGRTGITISGGWNSDYTSNDNGWTSMRSNAQCSLINVTSGLGSWRDNLVFDKFLFGQNNAAFSIFYTIGPGTTGPSFAVKRLAMANPSSTSNPFVQTFTYASATYIGCGVWNPPAETMTLYSTMSVPVNFLSNYTNAGNYCFDAPTSCNVELWGTMGSTNNQSVQQPFLFGSYSFSSSTAIWNMNAKLRYNPLSNLAGGTFTNSIGWSNNAAISTFLSNADFYCNKSQVIIQNNTASFGAIQSLKNVGLTGAFASNSGIVFGINGLTQIDLTAAGSTIESKNPCFGSTNGGTAAFKTNTVDPLCSLGKAVQMNLSFTPVNDAEGLKTLDFANNIYYKDPINNVLKITGTRISAPSGVTGGFTNYKVLGVLSKPASSAPFTISLTAKADSGTWDQLAVQYGPQITQTIYSSVTLTGEYATYTLTIDPTAYADWSTWIFPLYIGMRSDMPNLFFEEPSPVAYVQSLTIL
jgi:hypothetical protein